MSRRRTLHLVLALALLIPLAAGLRARAAWPIAVVNGQPISRETVELLGSSYLAQLRQRYGKRFTPEMEQQAMKDVLDQIVTATLLTQEAERAGISASEAEIDSQVATNDY